MLKTHILRHRNTESGFDLKDEMSWQGAQAVVTAGGTHRGIFNKPIKEALGAFPQKGRPFPDILTPNGEYRVPQTLKMLPPLH